MTIEAWQVELPSGDILTVSLDDLDAAFADGHVTERTRVRRVGEPTWTTLACAAGLEAPAPKSSAPRVDPFVVPTPAIPIAPSSMAPLALDVDDEPPFAPKRRPVGIVLGICAACAALILSAGIVSAVSAPPKLASAAATNALAANGKTGAALPVATPAPEPPSVGEAVPAPAAPAVATPPARGAEKAARPTLPGRPKIAPKVPAKRPAAKPTKPAKAKRPF